MTKLLVIDYDFFFENKLMSFDKDKDPDPEWQLYDWGHAENRFMIEMVWQTRASGFLRNGLELPGLTGEQHNFWNRFDIDENAICYIAESNSNAVSPVVAEGVDEIWLYDAHHDCGYRGEDEEELLSEGLFSCENWLMYYASQFIDCEVHQRYPSWYPNALTTDMQPALEIDRQVDHADNRPDVTFDRVFVCRSGAWVPPWLDHDFFSFVGECPVAEIEEIGSYELQVRDFSAQAALEEGKMMEKLMHEATLKM